MKVATVTAVAALCGAVACVLIWRNVRPTAGVPHGDTSDEAVSSLQAAEGSENQSAAWSDREATRRKLESIRAALLQSMHDGAGPAPATAPVVPADPALHPREVLDQRMFSGPPNVGEAKRLESALRSIVASATTTDTAVDVACGSTICRVDLTARDNAVVEKSAVALSQRLPKSFPSAVVFPGPDGERSIYLAKNFADLAIEPQHGDGPRETHVMHAPQDETASP